MQMDLKIKSWGLGFSAYGWQRGSRRGKRRRPGREELLECIKEKGEKKEGAGKLVLRKIRRQWVKTGRSWEEPWSKEDGGGGSPQLWLARGTRRNPAGAQPGVLLPRLAVGRAPLPVGVKPVERIRAMAGGELAAEVADV